MSDWRLWQLADSAFPTGGFAHSGGLEAAYQRGWVRDSNSLEDYLRASATQLERGVMRFVDEVMTEHGAFAQIDQRCDLFLNNHVANRASRAQGSAMLYSAAKAFESVEIVKLAGEAKSQRLPAHLAPVFGVVARDLGIVAIRARRLFLFMSIRSILSAAVRLGIVGPIQAQQIQARFDIDIESIETEPVQTSPLLDLVHGTHDRLYSRLFQT